MRDDRDDPFDDFFREIERMMNDMMGADGNPSGFGSDTHLDIQNTDGEIRVLADLPGVEEDDLTLKCDGETFTISANTSAREFDERIELPSAVDERSAEASFNNGVLEVRFQKAEGSTSIDLD